MIRQAVHHLKLMSGSQSLWKIILINSVWVQGEGSVEQQSSVLHERSPGLILGTAWPLSTTRFDSKGKPKTKFMYHYSGHEIRQFLETYMLLLMAVPSSNPQLLVFSFLCLLLCLCLCWSGSIGALWQAASGSTAVVAKSHPGHPQALALNCRN